MWVRSVHGNEYVNTDHVVLLNAWPDRVVARALATSGITEVTLYRGEDAPAWLDNLIGEMQ